jgi:hypothetical protein
LRFDDFDDDGQIAREMQDGVGVLHAGTAESRHPAQHRGAGVVFLAAHFDDGFGKRLTVPLVRFAKVNAHEGAFAMEFLIRRWFGHKSS